MVEAEDNSLVMFIPTIQALTCNVTAFESSQRLRLSIKYDLT